MSTHQTNSLRVHAIDPARLDVVRAAGKAIREIVREVEVEWEQQLGPRKFAQLRDLLAQLNAIVAPAKHPA